jgi:hypothetical protein
MECCTKIMEKSRRPAAKEKKELDNRTGGPGKPHRSINPRKKINYSAPVRQQFILTWAVKKN